MKSYTEQIIKVDTYGDLPVSTQSHVMYFTLDTSKYYIYRNSAWEEVYSDSFTGTVTSVDLSMPSAFTVSNSPITSTGTINVTANGASSQYIRGDGQLSQFPTQFGGGSSVNYYANGGTNQGTFGGNTYYQLSKIPDTGANVDFTLNHTNPTVRFITDINQPDELTIPAGSWVFRTYLAQNNNSGNCNIQISLYKYDGDTFTLISTGQLETITGGTIIDLYTHSLTIPSGTVLNRTDRLAIEYTGGNFGGSRTLTLHTQDSHLAQIQTTYSTGLNSLNGLTDQVQFFQTGTSGSDFTISSSSDTHTFNIPTSSASNRGALSSADWTTFNNKVGISGTTTANYVSKFSASGIITNSQIQDNGTNIGINSVPIAGITVRISSTEGAGLSVIESKSGNFNTFGVTGTANGITTHSSGNKGVQGNASGNTQLNIGVSSQASGSSAKNIGLQGIASGATNNYGARLIDGTEGVGKFLKSVTANGESNWSTITTSDISGFGSYITTDGTTPLISNWNAGSYTITSNKLVSTIDSTFSGITVGTGLGSITSNTALGLTALSTNTTGYNTTASGAYSLKFNQDGYDNTATGTSALYTNISGHDNTATGTSALYANTGDNNTADGSFALRYNIAGSRNVGVGALAGLVISDNTSPNTSPDDSIFIGYNTKALTADDTNQIVIGYAAVGNGSNTITLGNNAITDTYLRGFVHFNGAYKLPTTDGSAGQVLTTNGSGTLSFTTPASTPSSGNMLIAMTELTSTSLVTYTIPTGLTFQVINLNSDATNRYAKITFIAPSSGKVSIEMEFDMAIVNSAAVQMIGLHTSSTSTTTPALGWYRVNADNDSAGGQFKVKFIITGLTSSNTYSYYFMGVCDFSSNTIRISKQQTSAYVAGSDLPQPLRIFVYDLDAVSIVSNPSS